MMCNEKDCKGRLRAVVVKQRQGNNIYRYRKCDVCKRVVKTLEIPLEQLSAVIPMKELLKSWTRNKWKKVYNSYQVHPVTYD